MDRQAGKTFTILKVVVKHNFQKVKMALSPGSFPVPAVLQIMKKHAKIAPGPWTKTLKSGEPACGNAWLSPKEDGGWRSHSLLSRVHLV